MFEVLFFVGGLCLILGVVYPVCSILVYPFYRILGGKQKLLDYLRDLEWNWILSLRGKQ